MSSSSTPSAASTSVEEFPSTISHFPVSPPGWSSRTAVDGSFKLHPFPNPSLTNTNTIPGMISIRIQQLCVPIQDGEFHRRTKTKDLDRDGNSCDNLRPLGGNVPAIHSGAEYIVGNFDGDSKNKYSFRGDEFQLLQQ
ncbi:hypothetical protein Patl1_26598 [Pistacia atlantica]|uniref:Uncharacterized protein n=1 Tax=Pistacia atlantica TaxID=434234 RepID=A0ACC1B2W5_9ROSI|nr:hypothetical protein Patl1_26598 [Pistacia atlantica]